MIEIQPVGLPRDPPGTEFAREAQTLGTNVDHVVPQDDIKSAASIWEWRVIEGELLQTARI